MLPCSEVHWKILPAISRELAAGMEKAGMPRGHIALALGTTPAAISQYLSGKRGGMRLDGKSRSACAKLAGRIAKGKVGPRRMHVEMAKIVAIAKGTGLGKDDPCVVCATRP